MKKIIIVLNMLGAWLWLVAGCAVPAPPEVVLEPGAPVITPYAGAPIRAENIRLAQPLQELRVDLGSGAAQSMYFAAFAPHGRQILLRDPEPPGALWLTDVDGRNPQKVAAQGQFPAFSPDGTKLGYAIRRDAQGADVWQLWVVDLTSGARKLVTTHTPWAIWFDSETVLSGTGPHELEFAGFWLVDIHSGKFRPFELQGFEGRQGVGGGGIVFSPDRRWLATGSLVAPSASSADYKLVKLDSAVTPSSWRLGIARVHGDWAQLEVDIELEDTARWAWSPDSSRLVYAPVRFPFYVINADGTNRVKMIPAGHVPTWSPDGQALAFVKGMGVDSREMPVAAEILVVNADGSELQPLTRVSSAINLQWAPDGTRLMCGQSGTTAQVMMLELEGE